MFIIVFLFECLFYFLNQFLQEFDLIVPEVIMAFFNQIKLKSDSLKMEDDLKYQQFVSFIKFQSKL